MPWGLWRWQWQALWQQHRFWTAGGNAMLSLAVCFAGVTAGQALAGAIFRR